ncbi:MAG: hypothetical protein LBE83_08315, partial [Propionibacteriaceae bacterium]|nr:hypothetical protein [Propionibacteriaceae bacterium]
GSAAPYPRRLYIDDRQTPSVVRWLGHHRLCLGAILRSPGDFTTSVAAFPLMVIRGDETFTLPDDTFELALGDEIVLIGTEEGFNEQSECLYDDSTLYYTATGRDIPTSKAWRRLTGQSWQKAFAAMEDTATSK